MELVLATRNSHKIVEIRKILEERGGDFRILTHDDFPECGDVEEDGQTFEANAVKKAAHFLACTGISSVADDSGLEVEALNGAPGVFSARYAGESVSDEANTRKVMEEMVRVPHERRGARFVCCIALASSDGIRTFTGHVSGRIGDAAKGHRGFGYDPVFYPDGYDRTFAEMSDAEKNSMSHRAEALRKLQNYLLGKD